MKMRTEFKLEVHEAHGHKLKFQFNHLQPVYLNLELDRTKLTVWIQNHHQMQLRVPNLRLRYRNTT